jgi:hypothetical protein
MFQNVPECSMSGAHIECAKQTQFRKPLAALGRAGGCISRRAGRVPLVHKEGTLEEWAGANPPRAFDIKQGTGWGYRRLIGVILLK